MSRIFIVRGIPLGETQVGFAGSPPQVLQQRIGDLEGLSLVRRWKMLEPSSQDSMGAIHLMMCNACKGHHDRHPLCRVEQCPRRNGDDLV